VRWNYQRYMHDYLDCVAGVDDSVGRLLAYLDESGLAKNTVVIYSSDQGFYLGEHGWYDKRWMYEESLRTPLLVRWPGVVKPGSEVQAMTMNLDYAQTLLDIAGAAAPADMQGASLLPLLRGEAPQSWRNSLYYHYYEFPTPHHVEPHYGVRTERYKLIHFYRIKEWELFDLRQDPHELRSVADDPAYASIRAELLTELRRLQTRYADSDPDTYTPPPERKPAKRPKARS
jgi:arylsulfatase A-like enzyme